MYKNRLKRAAEVLGLRVPKNGRQNLTKMIVTSLTIASLGLQANLASAATLSTASVALSDPRPSQTATYTFTGSSVTSTLIKCIKVTAATTNGGATAPTGFDMTSAAVSASSTLINSSTTGWSAAFSGGVGNKNILQYTNASGITPGTTTGATFIITSITNSSVQDTSYFYTVATFNNTDCATSPVDNATVKFINTNGSTLSLSVDPTLTFTINAVGSAQSCDGTTTTAASTSTTIPFGSVTSAANAIVCQDLTAATNATNGYTIYARYTAKPTNALSQTIADSSGSNGTPAAFTAAGTEAYGYSTNDSTLGTGTANRFTSPSQGWAAMTTSNAEVAYEPTGVSTATYRIGHQVGVSLTTKPGTYTTTIIYTCTPVY
jgi:hypothetical protein